MQVITLTITGLAMGITILIGQKLGQGKKKIPAMLSEVVYQYSQ